MRKNILNSRPIAQRTCAGCRQVKGKRDMVRLVRTIAGGVEIDRSGKKEGRGTYLCLEWACWEKALKGRQLERAIKGNISREELERLYLEGKELLKELASG